MATGRFLRAAVWLPLGCCLSSAVSSGETGSIEEEREEKIMFFSDRFGKSQNRDKMCTMNTDGTELVEQSWSRLLP